MKVYNRRARFDYYLLERLEVGIVLTGAEVKSVKKNKIKLRESFVRLASEGAFLVNAHIPPYKFADNRAYEPTRSRKLLLHKREILSLAKKIEGKNLTLVPVSCYTKKGKIKLEVALARGKRKWDKRAAVRKRDLDREMARELRE
jgi:SsrA-binding protein